MAPAPDTAPAVATCVLLAFAETVCAKSLAAAFGDRVREIVEAATADEVWSALERTKIDLLYVRLRSPADEASTLIEALRRHPRTQDLPIVAICDGADSALLARAFEVEASAFLLFPVEPAIVPVHLDYVLRHARKWVKDRVREQVREAKCRAREAFLGGACIETLGVLRQMGDLAARALREHATRGGAGTLVAGLRAIDAQVVQLDRLIGDAMEAANEVPRSIVAGSRPAQLSLVVSDALAEVAAQAAQRNIEIAMSLPEGDAVISCDDDALAEALQHLLHNAVTHAPTGSRVEVEAKLHADGLLTIATSDRGLGMSPDFVARCVTPLAANIGYSPPRQRIGRGLLAARAIVEAHGGSIEIRTNLREGTMAMLVIPAIRVVTAADGRGAAG